MAPMAPPPAGAVPALQLSCLAAHTALASAEGSVQPSTAATSSSFSCECVGKQQLSHEGVCRPAPAAKANTTTHASTRHATPRYIMGQQCWPSLGLKMHSPSAVAVSARTA